VAIRAGQIMVASGPGTNPTIQRVAYAGSTIRWTRLHITDGDASSGGGGFDEQTQRMRLEPRARP